ncbi:MAG TPA: hypothetical protein VMM92_15755 [Thermoanaerobaculia bacterium]|nr:hypothetical protein [Thermoanaerobaculia bacterium]
MSHRQPLRSFQVLAHHPAVQALLATAAARKVPCHLVGGVLRDRLLGLPSHDLDAVVAGQGREIAETLAAALPARFVALGGREFAAFRLVGRDFVLDLWDRGEMSLAADLARRDFTVNSFAYGLESGEIADPFDGLGDLGRRVLRATTGESFRGDPLRVLRLPRLTLQLPGFAADPGTLSLARQSAPALVAVAAERVRDELERIFDHPEAHRGLALLAALDLYPGLWLGHPGEPQAAAGSDSLGVLREIEALPECIQQLRLLDAAAAEAVSGREARLAALFAHLPGGPGAAAAHLAGFRDASYLTPKSAARIGLLLGWLAPPRAALPSDDLGRRRFLHAAHAPDTGWPTTVCSLGARAVARGEAEEWRRELRPLVELAKTEGESLFNPPRLLSGTDLQTMFGVPAGPRIGRALAALRAAQVDGRVRTREEAVEILTAFFNRQA